MIYALDEDRAEQVIERAIEAVCEVEGVDLVLWLDRPDGREAVVRSSRGELRFAPGGELQDERGERWSVDGEPAALGLRVEDGRVTSPEYPGALWRSWSALNCPTVGRRAAVGRARLRVRRLGRRRSRRRRQPRLAAPLRFARRAALVRDRPGLPRAPRAVVAAGDRADDPSSTSAWRP